MLAEASLPPSWYSYRHSPFSLHRPTLTRMRVIRGESTTNVILMHFKWRAPFAHMRCYNNVNTFAAIPCTHHWNKWLSVPIYWRKVSPLRAQFLLTIKLRASMNVLIVMHRHIEYQGLSLQYCLCNTFCRPDTMVLSVLWPLSLSWCIVSEAASSRWNHAVITAGPIKSTLCKSIRKNNEKSGSGKTHSSFSRI